ncbi:hypothetical protein O181_064530 [Austropuccinia psidii MF-1]|uniref:Uncharacterized protein n=1 Tax=Austropuccinia psidii MF-1 TaxID=1389203 RepID=A0A9Q3I386_9BASI|nr:hypothetical protein [Austropuccinia psidii MF-1]
MTNIQPSSNPHISISEIKNVEKLTSLKFIPWQRGIISSLGMRNLKEYLENDSNTTKAGYLDPKQKQILYYSLVAHIDSENYDRFVIEDNENPKLLWKSIKEHYAFTSAKNIASHFEKLFSIKFPPSSASLNKSISLFR